MAYRHLMPIVVVVALVAGAMGAFLGFLLTEDEDAPPFAAVTESERGIVIERGLLSGVGQPSTTVFPLGAPDGVARLIAEQCGEASSSSATFCAGRVSISLPVAGEIRQITVPVACAIVIRVGDPWPTGLDECR